nr:nucleosome assembly protein 1;3-like [Ipomoea trifida]GLL19949.1 nucleosome assembly protein 1;3-like [Ipomoea trifida]
MLFPIILVQICEKDEGALAFLKDIEWSMVDTPGKSLTANTTRKKVAERAVVLSAKNKEPMTESEEESFSFFNFFRPLEVLSADHPDAEEVKQLMQQDYRIG